MNTQGNRGTGAPPVTVTLAFGPLRYRVPAPVPPDLAAFTLALDDGSTPHGAPPLVDPGELADRVVLDAPTVGAVVLHAAAVRVEGGVALLVAPPGTGKTTAAVHAGDRAFAYNGVLCVPGDSTRAWALPFAGGAPPQPRVSSAMELPVRVVLILVRGDTPWFEWAPGAAATTSVLRACVCPRSGDPHRRVRAVIALEIASRVRAGRLTVPPSPSPSRSPSPVWLDVLDRALKGM